MLYTKDEYEKQAIEEKQFLFKRLEQLAKEIDETSRANTQDRKNWARRIKDIAYEIEMHYRRLNYNEVSEIDELMNGYGIISIEERIKRTNRLAEIRGNRMAEQQRITEKRRAQQQYLKDQGFDGK